MRSILLLILLSTFHFASAQSFDYAHSLGALNADAIERVQMDINGDVITTGFFEGTIDFDPGTGVTNLTSTGNADVFVKKNDANGNLIWAVSFGSTI